MTQYSGVVFFDLDGTLLNGHSVVDDSTANAVHELKDNGYLPIIATGRSPLEIKDARRATGINTFITLNGGYIEYEGKAIYRGVIPHDIVDQTVAIGDALGEAVSFYTADAIRTTRDTTAMRTAYTDIKTTIPAVDPDYYQGRDILMLLILTEKNDGRYEFPLKDELDFYRNGPHSIDTVLKTVSKRKGIERLLALLKLTDIPTYAFGDGPNDLPMLEYVDHPVAMGNGITAAKDRAEFITSTNTADGIRNGLRHFNLIK
ncbi:Cof-type HAD-IIB family hydrolase [Schleiferilactobacillus perolens]|jgi:Cof subfamily protein (haloacid dehalogenase superfamily)|uniref:Cof-like hydrolase family protein n=1 Tax=Schleiferilactobacillus perolens DSM 12744 TaxID=1423792 RepID=A0A0R1N266_9LACO|nr:Cof-type HAD-IIB family hydrolase [Schleiferilactobacillus perolens]KRL14304.1 cof-like hydrolase family protein [Schleiferilactobacillus perolens DSM 12744]MCI1891372.1 Cof-type HAD-IIB family hydrolase [Schleiferilactobacillus harbinensis]MCI1912318.1 Cof-type HAD-IIB family hydrolase [Schleiferilactobacillus harbinensis]MCI2170631.1 Cof-type HAD-IIB family hydrolase [Schleiferilactobacillus perolens]